jgi:hypothetical protein
MALSHLGVGTEIQSDTEDSTEANACRRFFEQCRDELLSEFPWPFATKTAELALVANDPTVEWAFSYRYPEDCLKVQRIIGYERNESRNSRVPYLIQSDGDGGMLLYTDWQDTENGTFLVYTMRADDTSRWPTPFVQAMGFLLASYVGARVTSGDPMKLADRSAQFAAMARNVSQAAAVNEGQPEVLPESEFIQARGITYPSLNAAGTFMNQFGQG